MRQHALARTARIAREVEERILEMAEAEARTLLQAPIHPTVPANMMRNSPSRGGGPIIVQLLRSSSQLAVVVHAKSTGVGGAGLVAPSTHCEEDVLQEMSQGCRHPGIAGCCGAGRGAAGDRGHLPAAPRDPRAPAGHTPLVPSTAAHGSTGGKQKTAATIAGLALCVIGRSQLVELHRMRPEDGPEAGVKRQIGIFCCPC